MGRVTQFLTRKSGGSRANFADWITYTYLAFGFVIILLPVAWMVISSFKPESELTQFPPSLIPITADTIDIPGEGPLPAYQVTETGEVYGLKATVGRQAVLTDPARPDEVIRMNRDELIRLTQPTLATENYTGPLSNVVSSFNFLTFLYNSAYITIFSTIISVVINCMAGYALSRYKFRSRMVFLMLTVLALMIPQTVILVPLFLVVSTMGLYDNLWGAILPVVATPVGIFLMRQYMLTLPNDLFEAARIDGGSEWQLFWRVAVPLSMPAIAVLAILSIIWRWNDFLWPLIVLPRNENYTLQLGLNAFQGEFDVQWHYLLAMTVLSLLPVTIIFAFLQRSIASGIATTGMK